MEFKDLLYKRVLVAKKKSYYNNEQTVEELKILEISPSGKWVKVMNMNGHKHWQHRESITPVEVLADLEKHPNTNK